MSDALDGMIPAFVVLVIISLFVAVYGQTRELVEVDNIITDKWTETQSHFLSGSYTAYIIEINNNQQIEVNGQFYRSHNVGEHHIMYKEQTKEHFDVLGIRIW